MQVSPVFAKGSAERDRIRWFSNLMRVLAKEKWDTWGSEQVTSNLLISNTEDAQPLEFPKYLSYWAHAEVAYEQAAFIHFIGPYRFANGLLCKQRKEGHRGALCVGSYLCLSLYICCTKVKASSKQKRRPALSAGRSRD